MVIHPLKQRMSKEEFLALPEGPPDYEFEQGEAILMVRPHARHQKLVMRLGATLDNHVSAQHLGVVWIEIDVLLTGDRIYIPDIVYLSPEHQDRYHEEDGKIHGAPDLVAEILSPHSLARDRVVKFNAYFAAGVPWYWIVDPDALTIEEYHAEEKGYLRTASVSEGETFQPGLFPGLEINLRDLLR
ncbi:MAG TPA: Uma2 family endonuclease [Blastocatellia bacterium]|nr:Uma2 family endonuclease [Blastocatellia bacterium]